MSTQQPIGIFDSGVGGLTVASEITRQLPHESILYFGDTARCPYGPKDQREVAVFVQQIGTWLSQHDVKLIVIACNTATAAGLEIAQRQFKIPVIGVVEPGARAAVRSTISRKVGVIGTVGTIESGAYTKALRALDAGITVFSTATPRFVEMVEEDLRLDKGTLEEWMADASHIFMRPAFTEIARDYLIPVKRCDIDTLVLGCTHFPLLKPLISSIMGEGVTIISSSEETAREVRETLRRRGQLAPDDATPTYTFATTAPDTADFLRAGSRVFGQPILEAEHVSVETLNSLVPNPFEKRGHYGA